MRDLFVIFFLVIGPVVNSQETKIYPCKPVCNIGVRIAEYRSADSITKWALLKAGTVTAEAGAFTVLSYRLTLDGSGFCCGGCEIDNPGDKFSERTVLIFQKLRSGNFLSIDCITAKDLCGNIVGLKPAFYIIR